MTKQSTFWIVGVATLILIGAIIFVVLRTEQPNAGFTDATAVLTFIGGAAIAIERTIEVFWTALTGVLGAYWPLNAINRQVKTMEKDLDTALKPFHEKAQILDQLKKKGKFTQEQLATVGNEIDRMKTRFDELVKLTPDNQRMQLLAAAASQNIGYLHQKYRKFAPELDQALDTANAAINGLQDFLSTFKDNPGRRLISIFLGATIGLIVAGIFNLDVFQAVLGTPEGVDPFVIDLRVVATGLAIGLGSNPTHEVIKAIQVYKESRKGENIAKPNLPTFVPDK
jgi:hypothetical protein